MSWIVQKGKGRIVIDPSTHLDKYDQGALNDRIPKPGTSASLDECPSITYSNALERHCTNIWNLRISYPREDLLQHTDDIEGAFHRIPYHPTLGICYSYVFEEFLVIPLGMIFGSGDSPSWFGITAEPRSHVASVEDFSAFELPEAYQVSLPPPPTETGVQTNHAGKSQLVSVGSLLPLALVEWHLCITWQMCEEWYLQDGDGSNSDGSDGDGRDWRQMVG